MNTINPWLWLVPVGGFLVLYLVWKGYALGREVQVARARELFRLRHEHLEKLFFEKAATSGSPRGLRWLSCRFADQVHFARERHSRQIVALVPATVHFEAIEGGDMEGLPAVPLPRQGTAVLHFHKGEWSASGRVIFNMLPDQVLDHFRGEYDSLARPAHNSVRA